MRARLLAQRREQPRLDVALLGTILHQARDAEDGEGRRDLLAEDPGRERAIELILAHAPPHLDVVAGDAAEVDVDAEAPVRRPPRSRA